VPAEKRLNPVDIENMLIADIQPQQTAMFCFCYSTRDPLSPSQREPPNNRAAVVVQPP
jgi:hypothetical protein